MYAVAILLVTTRLHKLYGNVVPETVKNFEALLTGQNDAGVSYKGTEAYKVLDGLNIQVPIIPHFHVPIIPQGRACGSWSRRYHISHG